MPKEIKPAKAAVAVSKTNVTARQHSKAKVDIIGACGHVVKRVLYGGIRGSKLTWYCDQDGVVGKARVNRTGGTQWPD